MHRIDAMIFYWIVFAARNDAASILAGSLPDREMCFFSQVTDSQLDRSQVEDEMSEPTPPGRGLQA